MKINEFKQPKKIDEVSNLAGKMFGDVPMAALKGMLSGKGGKHQLAQDIFLRDFYQDAITSLDNGVKSGYVDPKKSYGTTSTTQSNTQFGNATPQNVGPASGASGTNVTPPNASNALNAPTLAQPGTNVTTKAGTTGTTGSITTGGPGAPATATTATTAPKPGAPATATTATTAPKPGAPATATTATTAPKPGAPATATTPDYFRPDERGVFPSTPPPPKSTAPKSGAPASTGTSASAPTAPKATPTAPTNPETFKPKPYTPQEKALAAKQAAMLKITGGRSATRNSDGTFSAYTTDPSDTEHSIIHTFDKDYNLIDTRSTKPGASPKAPAASPTARPGTPAAAPAAVPGTPGASPTARPTSVSGRFTQQGAAPTAAPLKPTSTNVKFNTPGTQQNPNNQQYKWAPKGMKIGPNTKLSSLGATGNLDESTYHNLNNIFESVISEMNGEGAATTTITDHMLEWFGQYMQGANWESKKAAILPHIKKIQDTYNSDKGKAAIKNLAKLAYAITGQRGSGMPAGAKNAVQNTTGTQPANNLTPEQIAAALAAQPPEVQQKVILQVQRMNVK